MSEADFRAKAGDIFQRFADSAGVTLRRHDEYAVASGRADTVYNRLVIEYKVPGKLTSARSKTNDDAIAQAMRYIRDVAAKEHQQVSRMAGIVLDGKHAIFIRLYEKTHVVDPAVELTPEVVERLLKYLASLAAGVALVPENLLRDFAIDSPATRVAVKALYDAISKAPRDSLSDHLFLQWQIFFQEISGYQGGSSEFSAKPELRSFVTRLGLSPDKVDPSKLLFSVHTYFALVIKLIAWLALSKHLTKIGTSFAHLATLSGEHLRDELAKLEHGGLFRELGIRNLLEGDFFGWYLDAWDNGIREGAKLVLERLADYDPGTLELSPESTRDLLKKLYHYLMPRELRHDLGEYYTPDWLAELVLNRLEGIRKFSGDTTLRILDPACGSGTFLVMAIKAVRETARREMLNERETLQRILSNIVGIDLNPLAVIASRTNYILAIQDLLEYRSSEIDLPVYLADSIMIPARTSEVENFGNYRIRTAVGDFELSSDLASRERVDALSNLIDDAVSSGVSPVSFLERASGELGLSGEEFEAAKGSLRETFEKIDKLHRLGLNGLWARIVKNAFAPLFVGEFDFVAGNPPWVNWESLPPEYRAETKRLWERYGLFPHGGMDTILGKGKKDISMLMTYVAIDKFLKTGGRLGFVITQSTFKTAGSGQGFRRFKLPDGTGIRLAHVDDMVNLSPFEGATNRTAVMVLEKGRDTTYPVPYAVWHKNKKGKSIPFEASLNDVEDLTHAERLAAFPVDPEDVTSPWLTVPALVTGIAQKILGKSVYKAREGVNTGGANGVFWLEIVGSRPDGYTLVRNLREGAKREVQQIEAALEPELIYPLVRGRNVGRWKATPSASILLVQDPTARRGMDESTLQTQLPKTYSYLKKFEVVLRSRPLFKRYFTRKGKRGTVETGPFYSMFNVGTETLAPWKVVWQYISTEFKCAVFGKARIDDHGAPKPIIPNEKLMMVGLSSKEEAHYLCGLLNSAPVRMVVQGFMVSTQIAPHVISRLHLPRFDLGDSTHRALVEGSERAHAAAANGDIKLLRQIEKDLDETASRIWEIPYPDLRTIWQVLGAPS